MTDKEFRRLNRSELLDIIFEYQKREREMRAEIDELKVRLASRDLKIREAGSIAEAVAGISGIFEKAQETADEYLRFVYAAGRQMAEEAQQKLKEADEQAAKVMASANALEKELK